MPTASVYVDDADLSAYLRTARLGELTKDDGTETPDDVFLDDLLYRTENEAHGYIGGRYAVPQDEIDNPTAFLAIAEAILKIATYRLFVRGLIQGASVDEIKKQADRAYEWLIAIQKNQGDLPSDAALVIRRTSGTAAFMSEEPVFGPDKVF